MTQLKPRVAAAEEVTAKEVVASCPVEAPAKGAVAAIDFEPCPHT